MRVLSVHNSYRKPGGEDISRLAHLSLLQAHGHRIHSVVVSNGDHSDFSMLVRAPLIPFNPLSYLKLDSEIQAFRPDVVHFHNTFPLLSPSVFWAAASRRVPAVLSVHNYRLLCLNACCYRDGAPCEACLDKPFPWPGVVHRCYRRSYLASGLCAASSGLHRVAGTWTRKIQLFLPVSRFAAAKLEYAGVARERIAVHYNTVHPDPGAESEKGNRILFAGRLDNEKGFPELLAAWREVQDLGGELIVAGDGPLLREAVTAKSQLRNYQFAGPLPIAEVYRLMGQSRCVVACSRIYETFGRTIMEAAAKGTAAIASDIGALRELVSNGETGLLTRPCDAADLARALTVLLTDGELAERMGSSARRRFESLYSPGIAYNRLIDCYRRVIPKEVAAD